MLSADLIEVDYLDVEGIIEVCDRRIVESNVPIDPNPEAHHVYSSFI
ncbi:protein of unknown function [Pseudorhizobium banfieldiae]|uniref:Uncharacterized protein n=1 Tax=Pseudorhizobium banfieldiae TaxID=1125847 RepID=L0NI66_9HYPH|nr:protein of unknown function [Pseudorhizobium banfieldiae]